MDHHCPWINNCIGQENKGYFLLFITYYTLASSLMVWPLTISVQVSQYKHQKSAHLHACFFFNAVVSTVLLVFSLWNWYLAAKGQTVIEFMQKRDPAKDEFTYELKSYRENLFLVFGTMSFFEMMLPIEREKIVNGLEWTFLNYADSQQLGRLLSADEDELTQEDLEGMQISPKKQKTSMSNLGLDNPPSEDDGMGDPF